MPTIASRRRVARQLVTTVGIFPLNSSVLAELG